MISLRDPECSRCPLSKGCRTICISGDGPLTAPILALGEAPGEYEDRIGKVFVGRSGQFYRAALEAVGLGEVRTENAVRCRPENNRTPTAEEREACSVYLERTVKVMPALRIVVAMGKSACSAVGWKGQLMKQAGTPFSSTLYGRSVTIVPIVHPAYILRNPSYASIWEEHWRIVKGLLTPPEAVDMDRICGRVEGPEEWWESGTGPLALDLETSHLEVKHASILSYAVSDGERTQAHRVDGPDDLRRLRRIVSGYRPIVVHNVGFEGPVCDTLLGVRLPRVLDTLLLQARVNPWEARSLAALTARHLPEIAGFKAETDTLVAQGVPYWDLPKDSLLRRNALDAWATARLHGILSSKLSSEALSYAEEDAQLLMFVARMQERGLWMDEATMESLGKEAEEAKDHAKQAIRDMAGTDINPGSNPQVGDLLATLGVRLAVSDAGNPVADEAALKSIRTRDPKVQGVIRAILSYRGGVKMQGTYLAGYAKRRDADGYIRSNFGWPGTVSWRPNSRNPNLLNIPRGEFRRVFKAPPGMAVIEGDMGQFQFRAVAVLCQDPAMLSAIRSGDPHGTLAEQYFGKGYTKDQRHHAKTCNFLLIFQGGPGVLQEEFGKEDVDLSWEDSKRYHAEFHALYSRLSPYWDRLYGEARSGAPVRCPTGGYSWNLADAMNAGMKVEDALGTLGNAQVQAVETRITLRAGMALEAEGILPVLDTYDGLIAYADEGNALDAARRMGYHLEAEAQKEPWMAGYLFPAECKVGPSWGEVEEVR